MYWEMNKCQLWSQGDRTGLACAHGCHRKELLSPFHFEDSLSSDPFCTSAQEQFVHLRFDLEQFRFSLWKRSLLVLLHCRCFSGRIYPNHASPAVRDGHCSTQRQPRWNMLNHYWALSQRLFPLMHMKQSTSSHIHPIYNDLLSHDQGCISVMLVF